MRKPNFILSAASGIGLAFGLIGCGGNGGGNDPFIAEPVKATLRMQATYDLSASDIPLPNDLLFKDSLDLTLNLPADDESDFSDPFAAASTLDGWSAVAPFSISFKSRDAELALDPSSIVAGSSVRVFKVSTFRAEAVPGTGIIAPTGPVTGVERELAGGLEYVAIQASATSIAILPTVPFEQQAGYMVIVTDDLRDTDGLAVLNDLQFAIVKSPVPIDPNDAAQAPLIPVQGLVGAMIGAANAFDGAISTANTILAYQFTVQSIGAVMESAKTLYVDGPIATGLGGGQIPATSFSSLGTDTTPFTGIGAADLYKGSISLTYLLSAPTEANPTAPLNTHWKALQQVPLGPEGALIPNPLGDNLSYANSFPRANGVETAPLLVSMPKAATCPKPANGYPVTIFQHGITSNRTALLPIADALAAAPSCRAAVSMDLPLHGIDANNAVHLGLQAASEGAVGLFEGYDAGVLRERTFGVDYVNNATRAPGADGAVDPSGAHTINLAYLLVSRDNTRQGVLDLLYLEQVIPFMDVDGQEGFDFDGSDISYIGHSLGGIVGTSVLAYSGTNQFLGEVSPVIKSAALANPGGGTIAMLLASQSFGPSIRAGLSAAFGLAQGTPEFDAQLASYGFAAQTIIDAGDPVNTGRLAALNGVPTLLLQNLGDTTVPNEVATAPLSGTIPLSRSLAVTTLSATEPGIVVGDRLFSKINIGGHASILIPDAATAEMQTQVVSFLSSGGTSVLVSDPSLLDE